jgi:hypothetical protein
MEAQSCPKCAGTSVMAGSVVNPSEVGGPLCFVPPGCPVFRLQIGVAFAGPFHYCLSCGHLWTDLAPEKLRSFIERFGGKLARDNYDRLVSGPYRGLPDDPEAHEAADQVAEIDSLVLAGKDGEATRRYRDLTGATWDQAVNLIRGWHDLERARKLALCGWGPKDPPRFEKSEMREHPMLDRWLDG